MFRKALLSLVALGAIGLGVGTASQADAAHGRFQGGWGHHHGHYHHGHYHHGHYHGYRGYGYRGPTVIRSYYTPRYVAPYGYGGWGAPYGYGYGYGYGRPGIGISIGF